MNSKVFVVIPAFRESKTIGKVVESTKKFVKNVVVVDDGSEDSTADISRKAGAIVLTHIINLGKGAALKTGCEFALRQGADIFIFMDADGQHDPADISKFINSLKGVDVVLGKRILRKKMPFILKFGNKFLDIVISLLYGEHISDSQCGYRALTKRAYGRIMWQSREYSVETEMIAHLLCNKLKYKEIPIKTVYLDKYKGTTPLHGFKILYELIKWRILK